VRPGGVLWLLRNELRLSFRELGSSRGGGPWRTLAVLGIGFVVLATLAGLPLAAAARYVPSEPPPVVALMLDWACLALFGLMLSQALAAAVNALFSRGDLDLLLSSPLDGRAVLAARGVGIATNPLLIYGGLALAVVVPVAVMGRPQFLAVLPVLLALALLATAAGIGLALGLFALIGPKATRTVGQALAAAVGASFFLVSRLQGYGHAGRTGAWRMLAAWATPERFGPASPLSWPARAAFGAPLPLLGLLVVSGGVFALTLAGLGRRFVADAAVSAGIGETAPARGSARPVKTKFSRTPLRAIVRKELRLLLRDPALLFQVGLRVFYLLPLCFVLFRSARFGGLALAPAVALVSVVAAQVAGSLAWITVSAEDAPDLLASSPIGGERARYAKLLAALIPLAVIMVAPLLGLLVLAPWPGLVALVGVTISCISSGLVNLWFEKPASRSNFRRRGGSVVTAIAEIALGIGWGVACAMAVAGLVWTIIPVCFSAGLLFIFWLMRRPAQAY
jgi:ABC-2 type transport system permease protein